MTPTWEQSECLYEEKAPFLCFYTSSEHLLYSQQQKMVLNSDADPVTLDTLRDSKKRKS